MNTLNSIHKQDSETYKTNDKQVATIISSLFEYLNSQGVTTQFVGKATETELSLKSGSNIPLDFVFSFRNKEGNKLEAPIVRLLYKKNISASNINGTCQPIIDINDDLEYRLLHPETEENLIAPTEQTYLQNTNELPKIAKLGKEFKKHFQEILEKIILFYEQVGIYISEGKISFSRDENGELMVNIINVVNDFSLEKIEGFSDMSYVVGKTSLSAMDCINGYEKRQSDLEYDSILALTLSQK